MTTPTEIDSDTKTYSQYGIEGDPTAIKTFPIIPHTSFGLDDKKIASPSIDDYNIAAYLTAKVTFGLDLIYRLDLGSIQTKVHAVSAVDIADNDPEGYAADPDGDLYTNYILDSSKAKFQLLVGGAGATTNSFAKLYAFVNAHFAIKGAGLYDGNDPVAVFDIFDETFEKDATFDLFDSNQPPLTFNTQILKGSVEVPKLPSIQLASELLDYNGYRQAVKDSADGPSFASLTFNPIPLIPVLGQINEGSYDFIKSFLVDAGIDYKLITAEFTLGAKLSQTLSASITDIDVAAHVEEKLGDGSYALHGVEKTGKYGDKLDLDFSTGDHLDTHIVEDYTIKVRIKSQIDLTPYLQLNLGLLHLEAFINPILIDELRIGFDLFSAQPTFDITSIQIVPDIGFDVTVNAHLVTQVDTHLPVVGTQYSDDADVDGAGFPIPGTGTLGADGNYHKRLILPGNQIGIEAFEGDDIVVGNPSSNQIAGGPGNDNLYGGDAGATPTANADIIHGGSGWDVISGGVGNDILFTDAGGAGAGQEVVHGDDGNDVIYAEANRALLYGDAGNDTFYVNVRQAGGQTIDGGTDTDRLQLSFIDFTNGITLDLSSGATSRVFVSGSPVTQSSYSGIERVDVIGSNYADTLTGSDNAEFLSGYGGDDVISGHDGNDTIFGGLGNDLIHGDSGNDNLNGGSGDDIIFGDDGNDVIYGNDGNDLIAAGKGADTVSGGAGNDGITDDAEDVNDTLNGGSGNDIIHGGGGHDTINGGTGDDTIYASTGGSEILGKEGRDKIYLTANTHADGGLGSDTYYVDGSDLGFTIDDQDTDAGGIIFAEQGDDRLVLTGVTAEQTYDITDLQEFGYQTITADSFGDGGFEAASLKTFAGVHVGTYLGIESYDITGSSGDDKFIVRTGGDSILRGGDGNDYLDSRGFGDSLFGDAGDDILVGGPQSNIDGGSGTDTLVWEWDTSRFFGSARTLILNNASEGSSDGTSSSGHAIKGMERLLMLNSSDSNDKIIGGALDDVIKGGDGNDTLTGLGGDDRITAGQGGDTVYGGDGNDFIDITDTAVESVLTETYTYFVAGVETTGTRAIAGDVAYGGAGNDSISATNTASFIDGGTGNDTISISNGGYRGAFITEVQGGDGNDFITGSAEGELIVAGNDARRLVGATRNAPDLRDDYGLDDDYVFGYGGNDEIWGGRGNDYLVGGAGTDTIHGGTGQDYIAGAAPFIDSATDSDPDMLYGDEGDDEIEVAYRATADGGEGTDMLTIRGSNGLFANAVFSATGNGTFGSITYISMEKLYYSANLLGGSVNVTGAQGDDHLLGSDNNDTLDGASGSNVVEGNGGDDIIKVTVKDTESFNNYGNPPKNLLSGGSGIDAAYIDASTLTHDAYFNVSNFPLFDAPTQTDWITLASVRGANNANADIERYEVTTGSGNDIVVTGSGNDVIRTGAGSDYVRPGAGTDFVDLGDGDDFLFDQVGYASPANAEEFYGGNGNDYFLLGGQKAKVFGGNGNDIVVINELFYGSQFTDTPDEVDLGAGDDRLESLSFGVFKGGSGIDRVVNDLNRASQNYTTNQALTADFRANIVTVAPGWSFEGFEQYSLRFGYADDTITMFYGYHDLDGRSGNNKLTIYADSLADVSYTSEVDYFGAETRIYANGMRVKNFQTINFVISSTPAIPAADTATTSEDAPVTIDVLANDIENDGGAKAVGKINGIAVVAGQGVTLASGAVVTLRNDGKLDYNPLAAWKKLISTGKGTATGGLNTSAIDSFDYGLTTGGSAVVDVTVKGVDSPEDEITGNGLANTLTGTAAVDRIVGLQGDDMLDGGAGGPDTLIGGSGDDVYTVRVAGDTVVEALNEGSDTVRTALSKYNLPANVEKLTYTGAGSFIGIGNGLDNVITGGLMSDVLGGGAGNDTLIGGDGAPNELYGGTGDDTFILSATGDTIVEFAGEGRDLVKTSGARHTLAANVEDLTYTGSANFVGIGNVLDNVITGGVQRDVLAGGAGNDTLIGGSGAFNELYGGTGDDIFVVSTTGDSTIEYAGEGRDLVMSSAATHQLAANVEDLTYTGAGSFVGIGNALDNVIKGGTLSDTLAGGAGNDTLWGGAGAANTLFGGDGDDVYVVEAVGDSTIEALNAGTDSVRTALGSYVLQTNVESLFYTGAGAFAGQGNALGNMLTGGAGDDTLSGLDGDDMLIGGSGADLLIGGAGADIFRYLGGETGFDRIIDFDAANDKISLATAAFVHTAAFAFVSGDGNAVATTSDSTFVYDTTTGLLKYDADGNGAGASVTLARLNTGLTLSQGNFVFA